jgi:hypothetical protein
MAREQNLKPFEKGYDKRRNLKGAPPKSYAQITTQLKKLGYVIPSRNDLWEMFGLLTVMTEAHLKEFVSNVDNPHWIRSLIIDMNDKKVRQKLMSDYRDWLHGKAKQEMDVTSKGEQLVEKLPARLMEKLIDKL